MRLSRRKVNTFSIAIAALFLLWLYFPSIKVSSRTATKSTIINSHEMLWKSEKGIEIRAIYVSRKNGINGSQSHCFVPCDVLFKLSDNYSVFLIEVRIDTKGDIYFLNVPAHIDSFVKDDLGNRYIPKNQAIAKKIKRAQLTKLLYAFEDTIFNHRPLVMLDKVVYGVLIFDKIDPRTGKITLEIPNIYDAESGDSESCTFVFDKVIR